MASVTAFYEAVDSKDLAGIAKAASPNYVAVFGAGCSSVGGARPSPPSLLRLLCVSQYVLGRAPGVWLLECGVATSRGA